MESDWTLKFGFKALIRHFVHQTVKIVSAFFKYFETLPEGSSRARSFCVCAMAEDCCLCPFARLCMDCVYPTYPAWHRSHWKLYTVLCWFTTVGFVSFSLSSRSIFRLTNATSPDQCQTAFVSRILPTRRSVQVPTPKRQLCNFLTVVIFTVAHKGLVSFTDVIGVVT